MDTLAAPVREKIFGARNLTTQDVVDHFLGNTALAEAYLNGLIDWAGNLQVLRFIGESS
jgi:hypothetical protein